MADREDILVKNLQGALDQAQRYVIAGILSAGLSILIDSAPIVGEKVDIPFVGKAPPKLGIYILLIAVYFSACFAFSAIRRARKIISQIPDKEVVNAALTQFTIFTIESRTLKILAVLLAPGLVFGIFAYVTSLEPAIEPTSEDPPPAVMAVVLAFMALLYFLPYFFLLYQAIIPLTKKGPKVAPEPDK